MENGGKSVVFISQQVVTHFVFISFCVPPEYWPSGKTITVAEAQDQISFDISGLPHRKRLPGSLPLVRSLA